MAITPRNHPHLCESHWSTATTGCKDANDYLGKTAECKNCPFVDCRETSASFKRKLSRRSQTVDEWRQSIREKGFAVA